MKAIQSSLSSLIFSHLSDLSSILYDFRITDTDLFIPISHMFNLSRYKRTLTSKNVLSVRNRWNWPKSRKVGYETLWKSDILYHFWNFRTLIRTMNLNLANSKYIWNILNRNNRHVRLIKMFILFHFMFYLLWFPSKF